LIDKFHNGAQPIDQFAFRDNDGKFYLIYGGWRHCNIAKLNDDLTDFEPNPYGITFHEITPEGMLKGLYVYQEC
jgi:beta-xylosidase